MEEKLLSNPKAKDEEDDDFFGNQDGEDDDFGALTRQDHLAKEHELKTIGYFESYDDTKEERLQEGFEAGYKETFGVASRIGELYGQMIIDSELEKDDQAKEKSRVTSQRLHDFLKKIQNGQTEDSSSGTTSVKESLELLEEELCRARQAEGLL